jgi:hypothetical protein
VFPGCRDGVRGISSLDMAGEGARMTMSRSMRSGEIGPLRCGDPLVLTV